MTVDGAFLIDTEGARDLAVDVIDEAGLPRVMPADFYAKATVSERGLLGVRHGLYCLPTVELVDWLRDFIDGRKAVEIGAGNGRLAEAVDIVATDSYLQERPEMRAFYASLGQPLVRFGPNVLRLDAREAIRKYRPQVVVGSWVTHKYNARRHGSGGNMYGPDTDWVLQRCEHYVLIGNEKTHAQHPLWARTHSILYPSWLYSRAVNGSRDFIAIWRGAL
jgi:hypothetical protein